MNDSPPLDVVAVAAHPDDVEVACGATLAKLVRQGYRVGIIDLTDGEPTPNCPSPEVRAAEARAAAETLGVQVRIQLGLPNRRLMDGFDARVALAKQFRIHRPRIVIGFGDATPTASPDHWQAKLITDAAVFYSRLTKWDQHFDGLPVHAVRRQLYFRLALEPDTIAGHSHHLLVDVAATLQQKIDAILCYQSQFAHKPAIESRIRAAALVTGSLAGVDAAESFVAVRPVAVDDLVTTVL
ncbi:PIG-L family deacetylase [Crateriforma spongiae]|uniref:PIG-L family deacetylase n=1 Tax=Crateriforma spongiae TaxID=2724528 RepID=UPI001446291C|nr:PIG-L family deacetylase [Crateriforma spongiae]